MRTLQSTTAMSFAALLVAVTVRANPPTIVNGAMRCGINDYGWPLSSDTAPLGTGTGTLEIVSDGQGNYTSGQMTEQLADDTHSFGTNTCTFDLVRGRYEKKADGTTENIMTWKLRSGSDPHCGAIVTRVKNLGLVESARDFREFQRTSTSYVLDDGRTVFVASNPLGVSIGACHSGGD
jgi:hypothetical protein